MKNGSIITITVVILFGISCQTKKNYKAVDYSNRTTPSQLTSKEPESPVLSVVISTIYSAGESYSRYNDMMHLIGERCSMPVKVTYCKQYKEVYRLFKDGNADIGIVCPSVYVIGKRHGIIKLLVGPVIEGKKHFEACIIVPQLSPVHKFNELEGRTFSFTDNLSLAGYFYPVYRSGIGSRFWKQVTFSGSHDDAIDLVNRGIMDGASVSSHVLEYIAKQHPEKTKNVRILEKSEEFGLSPVVIGTGISAREETILRNAFTGLAEYSAGQDILSSIDVDRFIPVDDSLYASAYRMVPDSVIP